MKRIIKILMITLTLGLLVSCGAKPLEKFEEAKLIEGSEKVIKAFNDNDYKGLYEMQSEKLKSVLTMEKLEETIIALKGQIGEFKSVKERAFQEKENFGICVALSEFEKGEFKIQTSFNEKMELEGFAIVK